MGVSDLLMFAAGSSWLEHLDRLFPIILVVAIGLLTLLKRFFEKAFKGETRPPPSRRRSSRPRTGPGKGPGKDMQKEIVKTAPEPPEPSVFEEMKKYFELIEGKPQPKAPEIPAWEAKPSPLPPVLAPPPPEVPVGIPVMITDPSDLVADLDDDIQVTPEELGQGVIPESRRLRDAMTVTTRELRRGSGPSSSRKRKLDRVQLGRGNNRLREAFLWHEILGNPLHKRRR